MNNPKGKSTMMTRLLLLGIVLLISTASVAEIDYQQKYRETVDALYTADQIINEEKITNEKLRGEVSALEAKEKSRRIVTVPFTEIAVTTEHAQGAIFTIIFCLLVL